MNNITTAQINACEFLIELEDIYMQRLIEEGDSEEVRLRLQPIRDCINHIKEVYKIEDDIRTEYDRHSRLIRASIIYKDIIKNINNENEGRIK